MNLPKRASREVNKFRALARKVIDHHFGKARRVTYLSGGASNFVFSFNTADGDFVIRISPDPHRIQTFMKEQWAVNAARKVGVPAAEILEVGSAEIGLPFMVTRAADGSEAVDHQKRPEILKEMGRISALINSIPTKGYGQTFDWSDNKLSFRSTFAEWLEVEYNYEEKLETLTRHKVIDAARSRKLKRIFADAGKMRTRPCLNHGDMRLKNVIVDEAGSLKAVIDWEGALSMPGPAWELSIALHDLGIDGMQHFLSGYGMDEKKFLEKLPLIKAFNITNYAQAVNDLAASNDKRLLSLYRLRLGGALDLYSI
jgi:aminoglycoside phosphotransferase (APT) family kinase protein